MKLGSILDAASNWLKTVLYANLVNGSAPSTPASGTTSLYATTGKKVAYKDDTGAETILDLSAAATASTGVQRDASGIAYAAQFKEGYTSTATAAGTTTLTVASNGTQVFTGTTTQTLVLPNCTMLSLGWHVYVINDSTGIVTVNDAASGAVFAMPGQTRLRLTCKSIDTAAGVWEVERIRDGLLQIASADSTTTLTVNSPAVIEVTGSSSHTIRLPATSTLWRGWSVKIINSSDDGQVVVERASGADLVTLLVGDSGNADEVVMICNGTSATSWQWSTITKNYAAATYQPIGNYLTPEQGRTAYVQTTPYANVWSVATTHDDGTEDDLHSFTIDSNTLAPGALGGGGMTLFQEEIIQVSATAGTYQLYKKFAGNTIYDSGALSLSAAADIVIRTAIMFEAAGIVRCWVTVVAPPAAAFPPTKYTRLTGLDLTATNVFKATAKATGTGCVVTGRAAKTWLAGGYY